MGSRQIYVVSNCTYERSLRFFNAVAAAVVVVVCCFFLQCTQKLQMLIDFNKPNERDYSMCVRSNEELSICSRVKEVRLWNAKGRDNRMVKTHIWKPIMRPMVSVRTDVLSLCTKLFGWRMLCFASLVHSFNTLPHFGGAFTPISIVIICVVFIR